MTKVRLGFHSGVVLDRKMAPDRVKKCMFSLMAEISLL